MLLSGLIKSADSVKKLKVRVSSRFRPILQELSFFRG